MSVQIDDAFVSKWHPQYDQTERDKGEYRRLVQVVGQEMQSHGTISEGTFLAIWKWKGAVRTIVLAKIGQYNTLYATAFTRAASALPKDKLARNISLLSLVATRQEDGRFQNQLV